MAEPVHPLARPGRPVGVGLVLEDGSFFGQGQYEPVVTSKARAHGQRPPQALLMALEVDLDRDGRRRFLPGNTAGTGPPYLVPGSHTQAREER